MINKDINSVFEIIKKRRSIRKFKDASIDDEKIFMLIESARLAPSATNRQPWRFIAVRDRTILAKLSSAFGVINRWAKSAPLLIVCCSVRKNIVTHYLAERITKIPFHILDVAIAAEHIILVAEELGLSSCWIGLFNEKKIKEILSIPKDWEVVSILAIGFKDENYVPKVQKRLSIEDILILK